MIPDRLSVYHISKAQRHISAETVRDAGQYRRTL